MTRKRPQLTRAKAIDIDVSSEDRSVKTDFNTLPEELCVRIFSYLHPIRDDLPRLASVCQRWKTILKVATSIWKQLYIDPTHYTQRHFNTLSTILDEYGNNIQHLSWKNNTVVYESVFALINRLTNLKYIRLPILWTSIVVEYLSPLSSLEDVQINGGYSLTDDDLAYIAKCFPQLKCVSLNACWGLTSPGILKFTQSLAMLHDLKLKINSCLRLNDVRSENAMAEGSRIVQTISESSSASLMSVLCLHYVPIELDELWTTINSLPNLKKLSISNCEHLHGIRLLSPSLQKLYLFNLWSVLFVSVNAPSLKTTTIDHGLESMEHLEVYAPKLRRITIDGSDVLRTVNIKSQKLQNLELYNCEMLDLRSLKETLKYNGSLISLKLGKISAEQLILNENHCPNIQELSLLEGFQCSVLHIRSPTLRFLQTETEGDLSDLTHVYVIANHLCKISLINVPMLRCLTVQCVSADTVDLNICSDDQLCLESCVIQAIVAIGFLRLFDCKVNMLCVSTPVAHTVVLYRCRVSDYALKMALDCCPNISYLNLEKCQHLERLDIQARPLQYLNLFGCTSVRNIHLECPDIAAINLGQCPNAKLFLMGSEYNMATPNSEDLLVVEPSQNFRWTHDNPPQAIVCGGGSSHTQFTCR